VAHRALITGIGGFAGGFLADLLLQDRDAVLGVSIDGQWEWNSATELDGHVELIPWDIGQPDGLNDEARRRIIDFHPTCLYHLAAISVPEDCGNASPSAKAMAVNSDGTRRVLELAAELPSRPRVVAISSSRVYAPVAAANCLVDESSPVAPAQGYGQTKLAAEAEVRRAVRQLGVDALIVRPFQHAGPRQDSQMMLAHWARQFAEGETGNVEDGTKSVEVQTCDAMIDLSDVRDVVRAYRLLAEYGRSGEIYNVGSGVRRRSGDVFEMLRRAAGSSRPLVQSRPGVKCDPIANTSRLRQSTGWEPQVPLETTLTDTLAWWRTRFGADDCTRERLA
jgi:GDP-4-dehydro-6-deoxy-D-mannose reductase